MASNDPIASQARKPALSIEDAERFASQIRPSWELLGPDASAGDFGRDDAPGVAAPAAGSVPRTADTIIDGVRPIVVAGSDEAVPSEDDWDDAETAHKTSEPEAPPIEAKVIASIGIASTADVPAAELPLPPQVGHPMIPTPGAPVAPAPAAKTKLGVGGTSRESAPMAKAKPTRAPVSTTPAPASAKAAPASASGKAVAAKAVDPTSVSRSRPGVTNPGAAQHPVDAGADDDIEIPISGAPKGLLLKIGGGIAAVAAILLAVKLFSGSSGTEPSKVPAIVTATAAATTPPPSLPTAAPEPPKATVTATAAPTVTATAAPTVKEPPVVAKVEPPPPVAVVKKAPPPPPAGGSTPPVVAKKKGGGIIRETPF
jgi:hypothetical protein